MKMNVNLDTAAEEFISSRRSQGYASESLRGMSRSLRYLRASAGDSIQVRNVNSAHIDAFFSLHTEWSAANHNKVKDHLSAFFNWCKTRRYVDESPLADRRNRKVIGRERLWVSPDRFEDLLDAAGGQAPRNRVVVALGLYLFLRAGEAATLQWKDVDWDRQVIHVVRHKTQERDELPICMELEDELRRWRFQMAAECGTIQPHWYIAPARAATGGHRKPVKGSVSVPDVKWEYRPTSRMSVPHRAVQGALEACGFPTLQEGGHTLRRSGARALYEELRKHDPSALRRVQSMLGHKTAAVTEHYLGLTLEREQRNDLLRGQRMFSRVQVADVLQLDGDKRGAQIHSAM